MRQYKKNPLIYATSYYNTPPPTPYPTLQTKAPIVLFKTCQNPHQQPLYLKYL